MTDNGMKSIYQKRTRIGDNVLKALIYMAAGLAIALLVGIFIYGAKFSQGNLWYSGKYCQHALYHCDYTYYRGADRNRFRYLPE